MKVKLKLKKFKNRTIKNEKIELYVNNSLRKKYIDVEETGKYEQDSFIMIYNLDELSERERNFVIHIYNILLGGGGLTSKLYRYLREENSLCYNVSSMIQKYDGLLMIYSGIDGKDKDLCIELVNKAMKEMSSGDFSDLELDNAISPNKSEVILLPIFSTSSPFSETNSIVIKYARLASSSWPFVTNAPN